MTVCLIGYQTRPGFSLSGVAYKTQAAKMGLNILYSIRSTAYGPHNTAAFVEAVYLK